MTFQNRYENFGLPKIFGRTWIRSWHHGLRSALQSYMWIFRIIHWPPKHTYNRWPSLKYIYLYFEISGQPRCAIFFPVSTRSCAAGSRSVCGLTVCAQMDIMLPVGSRFWGPVLAILKKVYSENRGVKGPIINHYFILCFCL